MANKENKIGAFWVNTTKDGKTKYLSGEFEFEGKKIKVVSFKNGFKETDNQPDWILYVSDKQPNNNAATTQAEDI